MSDTLALIAHERARIAVARVQRDDPFLHMELGYAALRLGELTGSRRRYQDAASEFQWTADLRPAWPYAWYWLGVAELGIGEAEIIVVENIRQVMGIDYLSQAVRAFASAVEADPGFSDALVELATTSLRQRIRARVLVALEALRRAAGTPAGRSPRVLLKRSVRSRARSRAGRAPRIAGRSWRA